MRQNTEYCVRMSNMRTKNVNKANEESLVSCLGEIVDIKKGRDVLKRVKVRLVQLMHSVDFRSKDFSVLFRSFGLIDAARFIMYVGGPQRV